MNIGWLTGSFPARVVQKFLEDQAPKHAVLIAWNTLFAVFPIIIFAASILGIFLSHAGFKATQFYLDVAALVPDETAQKPLLQALNSAKERTGIFFIVGLAGLLWSGSNLFGTLEDSFAMIYHTKNRGLIGQKLLAFAMMLVFTGLAGLVVLTSALLPLLIRLPFVPQGLSDPAAALVAQIAFGVVAGFVLFSTIYYIVPNRKQRLRQIWVGSAVAAVLFEVLTLIFPLYVSLNQGNSTYGSFFALLFVLLTFFYFLGLVMMLGVEVNSVLYPIPVAQPDRAAALAPPQSTVEGERHVKPSATANRDARWRWEEGMGMPEAAAENRPGRLRALTGVALASLLGIVVGRLTRRRR